MDAALWIGYLEGKFGHFMFWVFVVVLCVMLLKQVPFVGAGSAKLITGAAKDMAALGGKGVALTLTFFFNLAVNFAASALMLLIWAVVCGLIYGWYLIRLFIATVKEVRHPPMPEFPTAFGWIKLLPIKKPKNAGNGGGHH